MSGVKKTGHRLLPSAQEILEQPKYIDALQKKLGVNTLLCGESIRMPEWLRDMDPLAGKYTMFAQHADDDSRLLKAIEDTQRRGMRFWLYFSGHHNDPDEREVMSETFEGVKFADLPQIPYALSQGELTTCFEKPRVREYVRQLFAYAPRMYPVDGMYVSHTRMRHRRSGPTFSAARVPRAASGGERSGTIWMRWAWPCGISGSGSPSSTAKRWSMPRGRV